jgi:dethiobiotin synthetase
MNTSATALPPASKQNLDAPSPPLPRGPLHPALRQNLFIAGTDTGVGKTWVTVRLLECWKRAGYRVAGMKPVAAGAERTADGLCNEDALALLAASNVPLSYARCNPVCLARPTSPHLAAEEIGIDIDIDLIEGEFRGIVSITDFVAVEGAGGWFTPIADPRPFVQGRCALEDGTMADIAGRLRLPVLLVVGIRLGALNHALLTAEAIARTGLPLAGWVANPIAPDFGDYAAYVESLERRLPAPRVELPGF